MNGYMLTALTIAFYWLVCCFVHDVKALVELQGVLSKPSGAADAHAAAAAGGGGVVADTFGGLDLGTLSWNPLTVFNFTRHITHRFSLFAY